MFDSDPKHNKGMNATRPSRLFISYKPRARYANRYTLFVRVKGFLMQALKKVRIVIAVLTLISVSAHASVSANGRNVSGVVKVIVESTEEGKIENETVIFRDDEGWTESVRTDESGEASLTLPSGLYTVIVKRQGCLGLIIKDFEVRDDAKIERILHLKRRV